MSDLILHQYDFSPFSEKMRKVLGFKGLDYHSVDQPDIAPKPALTPLTGGYRRIPVLQIGAHVYCDTALMVRELERRFPDPCLTPPSLLGAAEIVADWADHRLFSMAALPTVVALAEILPPEFFEDRAKMSPGFSAEGAGGAVAHSENQMLLAMSTLDAQLNRTPFLLGEQLTLADLSVYHVVNFAAAAPVFGNGLAACAALNGWLEKIRAMDSGTATPMTQDAALDIARAAQPNKTPPQDAIDDPQLPVGVPLTIQADDYGQEVTQGEIVWTRENEVVVYRHDSDIGDILVHYPKQGYRLAVDA